VIYHGLIVIAKKTFIFNARTKNQDPSDVFGNRNKKSKNRLILTLGS